MLGNEEIQFNARFSGRAMRINTPTKAVLAIYAKENGKGMIFDAEEGDGDETPPEQPQPRVPQKPQLKVVK